MGEKFRNIQKKAHEISLKLDKTRVIGKSEAGVVTAVFDGNNCIKEIKLTEKALFFPKNLLEQEILSAVSNALEKSKKVSENEMLNVIPKTPPLG